MPNMEYLNNLYEQLSKATYILKQQQDEVNATIKKLVEVQDVYLATMSLVKNLENRIREVENER